MAAISKSNEKDSGGGAVEGGRQEGERSIFSFRPLPLPYFKPIYRSFKIHFLTCPNSLVVETLRYPDIGVRVRVVYPYT